MNYVNSSFLLEAETPALEWVTWHKSDHILKTLAEKEVSDPQFLSAIAELENAVFLWTEKQISPLREMHPDFDLVHEQKILEWMSQDTDLSRKHSASNDSRNIIAFKAWLIGCPEGKIFTKIEGEYVFARFIRETLWEIHGANVVKQQVIYGKISKLFSCIINFIETRLPDPFAKQEIRAIYDTVLGLTDQIEHSSLSPLWTSLGIRIRHNFINNYKAYLTEWHEGLETDLWQSNSLLLEQIGAVNTQESAHKMTLSFRLAQNILRSEKTSAHQKTEARETMSRIFHTIHWGRVQKSEDVPDMELEGIDHTALSDFFAILPRYNPHEIRVGGLEAADQAELDAFVHTFKYLPEGSVPAEQLEVILKNLLGNTGDAYRYHDMDNCQSYILLAIEEILRRYEYASYETAYGMKETLMHLDAYLSQLPHHPIHIDLVGLISIRLANLHALHFPESSLLTNTPTILRFIKGIKLLWAEKNDVRKKAVIQTGTPFLRQYFEEFRFDRRDDYGNFPDLAPERYSNAGFRSLTDSAEFRGYEERIRSKIDRIAWEIRSQMLEQNEVNHANTTVFLDRLAKAISDVYNGAVIVTIGEHSAPKLGDALRSSEKIGFGYSGFIEHPAENTTIIESDILDQKNGIPIQHEKIRILLSEVVAKHMHEFILQASSPEEFVRMKTSEQLEKLRQESPHKHNERFIHIDRYALYRRVFLDKPKNTGITIVYQEKHKIIKVDGSEVTSIACEAEMLARFKDPLTGEKLPLSEVFQFLDLLEMYHPVSRQIMELACIEGKKLGLPYWFNTRGDEFRAEFKQLGKLIPWLLDLLKRLEVPPSMVTLEILEIAGLKVVPQTDGKWDTLDPTTLKAIRTWKKAGGHIAMDDFGPAKNYIDLFNLLKSLYLIDKPAIPYVLDNVDDTPEWLYGEGDGLKFDEVYVPSLSVLAVICMSIIDAHFRATGEPLRDDQITLAMLDKALKEAEDGSAHLNEGDNVRVFLNTIISCRKRWIKCTMERLEPHHHSEIWMANILGLLWQGFAFHKPEIQTPALVSQPQNLTKRGFPWAANKVIELMSWTNGD